MRGMGIGDITVLIIIGLMTYIISVTLADALFPEPIPTEEIISRELTMPEWAQDDGPQITEKNNIIRAVLPVAITSASVIITSLVLCTDKKKKGKKTP